jgi:K+/H+ antiporter YhaU regulatory subunit KhtT
MSVSSLTKFTVPLATDQSASAQGLLMPKLKFRFRASFDGFGVSQPKVELTKQVIDIKRPSVNFNPFPIDVYNSKVYLQGKPEWAETSVNLRDDAAGNVAKLVGEQIQKQFDFMEQSSAASGIDYKFILRYEVLDGGNGANEPTVLETWEMYGCQISQVDYGDMNYGTNDPVTIALTIRFDNAIQSPIGTGVGSAVARTIGSTITG